MEKQGLESFVAELNHNHRKKYDSGVMTDFVELTYIKDSKGKEFREDNHVWIKESCVKDFIPKFNGYTTRIVFQAEAIEYLSITNYKQVYKKGFKNITNVMDKSMIKQQEPEARVTLFKLYDKGR